MVKVDPVGYELIPMGEATAGVDGVHGFLGARKTPGSPPRAGRGGDPRWPSASPPSCTVDRFALLYQRKFEPLFEVVRDDIAKVSPSTRVDGVAIGFLDHPREFPSRRLNQLLHAYARRWRDPDDAHDHLVHITTGLHMRPPDLLVPAHRVAAPPGAAAPVVAADGEGRGPRRDARDRPRPVALRPHRLAPPEEVRRRHRSAEVGHRHAQPPLQRARFSGGSNRWPRSRPTRSCCWARRARASRSSRGAFNI